MNITLIKSFPDFDFLFSYKAVPSLCIFFIQPSVYLVRFLSSFAFEKFILSLILCECMSVFVWVYAHA